MFRLETPAEAPDTTEVRKSQENVVAPALIADQHTALLRLRNPVTPGNGTFYWNLQQDVPLGWVSYSTPLGEGGSYPISTGVLLSQARPIETLYLEWNVRR